MSGGFFRGTSADQDTRFSNKQAKLLKSQKFAPELEHLVDMTKVKMEVMKPWIGRRVTELLGFEDEVLINFIFTLLEGKIVNGKEVQIQLTGFMEKNTGKFMKELWTLLLSAQLTASGVPQSLLDAKAEELQKKEAYDQLIASNIEKKKDDESKELQMERSKRMDGVKKTNFDMELGSNIPLHKDVGGRGHDDYVQDRNGNRQRARSPGSSSDERLHKSSRGLQPRRRRSRSHSRGFSRDRRSSRSLSSSPARRRRSRTPPRRRSSVSPFRRNSNRISVSPIRSRNFSRRRSSPSESPSLSPRPRRVTSRKYERSPSPRRYDRSSPGKHRRSPVQYRRQSSSGRYPKSSPPSRRHRSPSLGSQPGSPLNTNRDRSRRSPSPAYRRRSPVIDRHQGNVAAGRRNWSGRGERVDSPVKSGRSPYGERRGMRSASQSRDHRKSPSSEMEGRNSPPRAPKKSIRSPASPLSSSPSGRRSFSPPTRKYPDNDNSKMSKDPNQNKRSSNQEPAVDGGNSRKVGSRSSSRDTSEAEEAKFIKKKKSDTSPVMSQLLDVPLSKNHEKLSNSQMELIEDGRHKNSDSMKLDSDDSEEKVKRSRKRDVDSHDDESSDSEIEDKKEAKKRRKEEKKVRKEERRRRRDERRRRKDERRAEKHKLKERSRDSSDDEKPERSSLNKEAHDDQKRLEIELRNRALESYKAKKGLNR